MGCIIMAFHCKKQFMFRGGQSLNKEGKIDKTLGVNDNAGMKQFHAKMR